MINRYVLVSDPSTYSLRFSVETASLGFWQPPVLVSAQNQAPVITQENPGRITFSSFGMTPSWAKSPMDLLTARAEGDKNPEDDPDFSGSKAIFLKKAFRKPLFYQRCIVIADAFIIVSSGREKKPYLVFMNDHNRPFGMAGLYDAWTNPLTGEKLHSFCIITVPANPVVSRLPAARMPVILSRGLEQRWLKPANSLSDVLHTLTKYPAKEMNAYPVSREIMGTGPYTKEMLFPVGKNVVNEIKPDFSVSDYHHRKKREPRTEPWFKQANPT